MRYEELTAFQQEFNLANRICVTANWLCSRRLLDGVGRFDAAFMSGGDVECAGRIAAAGHAFVYAPDLVVRHPTRATLPQLLRKRRRVVGGRWQKLGPSRNFASFSKQMLREHAGQARWMRKSAPDRRGQVGILLVLGSLWVTSQVELVRLRLGGKPFRS